MRQSSSAQKSESDKSWKSRKVKTLVFAHGTHDASSPPAADSQALSLSLPGSLSETLSLSPSLREKGIQSPLSMPWEDLIFPRPLLRLLSSSLSTSITMLWPPTGTVIIESIDAGFCHRFCHVLGFSSFEGGRRAHSPNKKSHLLMYSTIKVRNRIQATPQGRRLYRAGAGFEVAIKRRPARCLDH
jgi:hypothetical protein